MTPHEIRMIARAVADELELRREIGGMATMAVQVSPEQYATRGRAFTDEVRETLLATEHAKQDSEVEA